MTNAEAIQVETKFRQESAVIENDTCASSLPTSAVTHTIGKTTYIANLHLREQGQTFSQKLKRVLIAE